MNKPTFLVSRTDKAGDLILTLPVFRELKKNFPQCTTIAHVRSYTAPLLSLCPEVDQIIIDDEFAPGLCSNDLAKRLASLKADHAIIVHPAGRAIIAAWRAGIKLRTGRASNLWQFLLNDRRVQKRSRNEKHEFCYNLDLITNIVNHIDYLPYQIKVGEKLLNAATAKLTALNMQNRPVVIHPGHGGSAHNITPQKYAELAQRLIEMQIPVLISLGPGEEQLQNLFPAAKAGKCNFLSGIPDLASLAAIFSLCSAFIGGSTGPLHLAAALQLPCVAFFPPVKAMTPERWGPVGCKNLVIMPQLGYCNGKCPRCCHSGCMNRLETESAAAWIMQELNHEFTDCNK